MEDAKKNYRVEATILSTHVYDIEGVNSPEEAESIVDAWLEEGEMGSILEQETVSLDSYPIEEADKLN